MRHGRLIRWLSGGGLLLVLLSGCTSLGEIFAPAPEPLILLGSPQPPAVFEDAYMATGDLMDHPRVSPPVYPSGTDEVVVVALFNPLPDNAQVTIRVIGPKGEPVALGETVWGILRKLEGGVTGASTAIATIKPQNSPFADGSYQAMLGIDGNDFAVLNWRVSGNRDISSNARQSLTESGATFTPAPSVTPTPSAAPTLVGVEHVVGPGETLGLIAELNNISVRELMAANGLKDEDELKVGQTLIVPVRIVLTVSTGDVSTEYVEVWNQLSLAIDISGWVLDNGRGDSFTFPMAQLLPGARSYVFSGVGTNTPVNLYWGRETPAFQAGDQVTLTDSNGKVWAHTAAGQ